MAEPYVIPNDITLEEKIEYIQNSLKPELKNRWHFMRSIESLKALDPLYFPDDDADEKLLKEGNEKQIKFLERNLDRSQKLIELFSKQLEPLLEQKAAQDLAAKLAAEAAQAKPDPAQTVSIPAAELAVANEAVPGAASNGKA